MRKMLYKVIRPVVCSILTCSAALCLAACGNDSATNQETAKEEPHDVVQTVAPSVVRTVVPLEPTLETIQVEPVQEDLIDGTEVGAFYEVGFSGFDIKWTNPEEGSYSLLLMTSDSVERNVFYGGHSEDYASVVYESLSLAGTETLVGQFIEHDDAGRVLLEHPEFTIDLSSIELATPEIHRIVGSEIGASYEVNSAGIDIGWANPADGSYALLLKTANSREWNLYHGGHGNERAVVHFANLSLSGRETLVGRFHKYGLDHSFVEAYSEFSIDLSTIELH